MNERIRFPDISSRAWEHPADRAALTSLKKIPGFDLALRKVMSLVSERPLKVITLGSAVEVSADQYPRVHAIYDDVLQTLDSPRRFELFITQNPVINAGAVGMDDPFIVLNSATVNSLSDDQLRGVLGHELGHIMSDHVLYKTMLRVLLRAGTFVLRMPLTGIALVAVLAGLMEWDRKSELSADRASLLAVQDPDVVRHALLRMAGGVGEGASIDAFRAQARRYEEDGDAIDSVIKTLALLGRRHPFPVQRLKEIDRWVDEGAYSAILKGDYPLRADDTDEGAWDYWKESVGSYADGLKASTDPVMKWVREAGGKAGSAFPWFRKAAPADEDEAAPTEDAETVDAETVDAETVDAETVDAEIMDEE